MEQKRQRAVQQQRPRNVRPRRKKRRAPIKELAICAAVIFVAGFLLGFLVRGAFLPKEEKPAETTQPPVETTTEQATEEPTTEEITTEAETVESIQESTAEPQTDPVAEKKGCGSVIGGAFAVVLMLGVAFVVKKKD